MTETTEVEKIIHLMHDIKKKLFTCIDTSKSNTDLTMLQIRILHVIQEKKEITMRALAELMEVKPASMTSQINILVNKEYINRINDKEDRRSVKVSLTKKGIEVYSQLHAKKMKVLNKMLANISEEEKKELIKLLEKLHLSISQF
jgi:DNA-binding MarR family transcriptional regulator